MDDNKNPAGCALLGLKLIVIFFATVAVVLFLVAMYKGIF